MAIRSENNDNGALPITDGVPRRAALLIGVGGSGILTARMAYAIAKQGQDQSLQRMVRDRRLIFFGIDTDPSENDDAEVDLRLLPIGERSGSLAQEENVPLPNLDDFVWVDTRGIVTAVDALSQDAKRRQERDLASGLGTAAFDYRLDKIAKWFPLPETPDDPVFPVSSAKENGAQQLRPLGRVGLFLNVERIYPTLKAHLQQIAGHNKGSEGPVEVYIISSLAGGTGSGMFWDIAFLTRIAAPNAEIRGMFLMPDAFSGAQAQSNAEPNSFAAIMELTNWKNWLYIENEFRVDYPLPDRVEYVAHRGGQPAFDSVYLIGPASPPLGAVDPVSATIRSTTAHLAGTILTYLRHDVRRSLKHKSQNGNDDSRASNPASSRRNIFGTATSIEFPYIDAKHFETALVDVGWQGLEIALEKRQIPQYTLGEFLENLARNLVASPAAKSWNGALPTADVLVKTWSEALRKRTDTRPNIVELVVLNTLNIQEKTIEPRRSSAVVKALRKQSENCKENLPRLAWIAAQRQFTQDCQEIAREVRQLLGLPEPVLDGVGTQDPGFKFDGFLDALQRESNPNDAKRDFRVSFAKACKGSYGLKYPEALLAEEIKNIFAAFENALGDVIENQNRKMIANDLNEQIGIVQDFLDEKFAPEQINLQLCMPHDSNDLKGVSAFVQIGAALNPSRIQSDHGFRAWLMKVLALPQLYATNIAEEYRSLFVQFSDRLEAAYKIEPPDVEKSVRGICIKNGENIRSKITEIYNNDGKMRAILDKTQKKSREDRQRKLIERGYYITAPDSERLKPFIRLLRAIADTVSQQKSPKYIINTSADLFKMTLEFNEEKRKQAPHYESSFISNVASINIQSEIFIAERRQIRNNNWGKALDICANWARKDDPYGIDLVWEIFKTVWGFSPQDALNIVASIGKEDNVAYAVHRDDVEIVMRAFARHWIGDTNLLNSRIGGDTGLYADLLRLRPDVFREGPVENPLRTDSLVVVLPKVLENEGGDIDIYPQHIQAHLRKISQKALNTVAISPNYSEVPVVYFEQLYRSPQEITRIEQMYRSYMAADPKTRRFFHISRDGASSLKQILFENTANHPVYCGNVGCKRDIRHLPRNILSCPECQKPIWNRCGNPECLADDVMNQIDLKRAGKAPEEKITKCPSCGDELVTYFWTCPDPAHSARLIERDKEVCPYCIAEHNAGKRGITKVHSRPDEATTQCPGCPDHAKSTSALPADLKHYFAYGVNGFKHLDFMRKCERHKRDPHLCTCELPQRHFTFPTCPEGRFDKATRHHVYRLGDAHFHCPQHPLKIFYTCHECGYPIEMEENTQKRIVLKDKSCPRCLAALRHCRMCSDGDRTVFAAKSVRPGDPERCPRCAYAIEGSDGCRSEHAHLGLTEAGFCRNLFSCVAGRDPWQHQTELSNGKCDACDGPKGQLSPADRLWEHVESCPVCLMLLGLPRRRIRNTDGSDAGHDIQRLSIGHVLSFMATNVTANGEETHHVNAITLSASCPVCGVRRGEMLRFLLTEYDRRRASIPYPAQQPITLHVRPSRVTDNSSHRNKAQILTDHVTEADIKILDDKLPPLNPTPELSAERVIEALRQFHQQLNTKTVRVNLLSDEFTSIEQYQKLCHVIGQMFDSKVFSGYRLLARVNEVENLFREREPNLADTLPF